MPDSGGAERDDDKGKESAGWETQTKREGKALYKNEDKDQDEDEDEDEEEEEEQDKNGEKDKDEDEDEDEDRSSCLRNL